MGFYLMVIFLIRRNDFDKKYSINHILNQTVLFIKKVFDLKFLKSSEDKGTVNYKSERSLDIHYVDLVFFNYIEEMKKVGKF